MNIVSLKDPLSTGSAHVDLNSINSPEKSEKSKKQKLPSYITDSFHHLKNRESTTFDPFEQRTAYSKRSKKSKMFGKLQEFSLRTGAVGYVSALMGTGLLAMPNGMAGVGWVGSIFIIIFSILCHVYSFYCMTHSQSSVKIYPFYFSH